MRKCLGVGGLSDIAQCVGEQLIAQAMRCYLRLGDKTLSETWLYQYHPEVQLAGK